MFTELCWLSSGFHVASLPRYSAMPPGSLGFGSWLIPEQNTEKGVWWVNKGAVEGKGRILVARFGKEAFCVYLLSFILWFCLAGGVEGYFPKALLSPSKDLVFFLSFHWLLIICEMQKKNPIQQWQSSCCLLGTRLKSSQMKCHESIELSFSGAIGNWLAVYSCCGAELMDVPGLLDCNMNANGWWMGTTNHRGKGMS